jgi:phosphatidylserine/phosphatidylglycerophosphate/cardiolipin synthase-like enzyme
MIIKIFFTISVFLSTLLSFDDLYFLPQDKIIAKDKIINLIKKSKKSINLAMFNINYKFFIEELNKASKNGVKINIFYTKKKGQFYKKINFYKTTNKLHTKIAIFDNKIIYYGSANWKKEAFKHSYEVINITNNKEKVEKFNKFFKQLKDEND